MRKHLAVVEFSKDITELAALDTARLWQTANRVRSSLGKLLAPRKLLCYSTRRSNATRRPCFAADKSREALAWLRPARPVQRRAQARPSLAPRAQLSGVRRRVSPTSVASHSPPECAA